MLDYYFSGKSSFCDTLERPVAAGWLLMISLKYHRLHPEYVHGRIEKIKNRYNLRILMVLCDVVSQSSNTVFALA